MKKRGLIYVLFTAVVFAAMEPASKLLSGRADAFSLNFCRFLVGSAVLLPAALMVCKKRALRLQKRDFLFFAAQGALCVCVSMGLLQLAVFRAAAPAVIAVVFCSNSVLTALLAAVLLGEKLTPRRLLAACLCMAGVALFAVGAGGEGLGAIILALIAALAMSLFTVLGKKYARGLPFVVQIGFAFPLGTIILGAALLLLGKPLFAGIGDPLSLCVVAFLGVAVTGLGYVSYFKAMETGGTMMASLVFFIKPVLAPVLSYIILGAAFSSPLYYVSLALVAAGSALLLIPPRCQRA